MFHVKTGSYQSRLKYSKPKRWICSCQRINDAADLSCAFCRQPKPEEKQPKKIKRKTAYDELHLWPVFSWYIRLRDSDKNGVGKCFTCTRYKYWLDMDCGHGAGRQHKGTKYNEINNNSQCASCNGFNGGMREVYEKEMDKRHGPGTWALMQAASRKPTKLSKTECDVMISLYSSLIEKLLLTKSTKVVADYRRVSKTNQ